jgi:hypothetical protein
MITLAVYVIIAAIVFVLVCACPEIPMWYIIVFSVFWLPMMMYFGVKELIEKKRG